MNATPQKSTTKSVVDSARFSQWPHTNDFYDLLRIAVEALRMSPPLYFRSIFGDLRSWLPPHNRFSEYNILDAWQPVTTLRYLVDLTVPAWPQTAPDLARALLPSVIERLFWRPTTFFRQPDDYGGVSTFPDEHWFFINGVATNGDVARLNAAYLAHLFHRPVSVIQNATDSLGVDLYECVIGKGFKTHPDSKDRKTMTEPAWRATSAILEAVIAPDIERVVVIAHSQGTIITANVLRAIAKALRSEPASSAKARWHPYLARLMGEAKTSTQKVLRDNLAHSLSVLTERGLDDAQRNLAKVEVYTFANCADKMRYVYPEREIPYLEHFANELDLVARLGVLSPLRNGSGAGSIEIDGPVFERPDAWGHLLNEHYLKLIDEYLYPVAGRAAAPDELDDPYPSIGARRLKPRLYSYFHGKRPPARQLRRAKPRAVPGRTGRTAKAA